MATTYILHNPQAGRQGNTPLDAAAFAPGQSAKLLPITQITNYAVFLKGLAPEDTILIAGGDGTLNRFVNDTEGLCIPQQILYYPCGTGNDFTHDLGKTQADAPFPVNPYLQDLPLVTVKGKTYRFLNGVGFGIDGYCCQVGDQQRKTPGKKVNYTAIAVKGLLFHFKPRRATITADGVTHHFQKVWIAPTMFGRFYGGGMIAAPGQDRNAGGKLSAVVMHRSGKLKTLLIVPSIFKGQHIRHEKYVQVLEGKQITVEFDRPTPLQIDGETILDVTSYTATLAPAK